MIFLYNLSQVPGYRGKSFPCGLSRSSCMELPAPSYYQLQLIPTNIQQPTIPNVFVCGSRPSLCQALVVFLFMFLNISVTPPVFTLQSSNIIVAIVTANSRSDTTAPAAATYLIFFYTLPTVSHYQGISQFRANNSSILPLTFLPF